MRQYKFTVIFLNGGYENVIASSVETASILAQANRIRQGMDYEIFSVTKDAGR